jgi:hypothetical protein
MTTPYSVSISKGSVSYDNYVNAPITGPLSTSQTPAQIPYHSYGILSGIRPTPPQFYPTQEPVYSDMNTNARQQYLRTSCKSKDIAQQIALGKLSSPIGYQMYSSQRKVPVSSHTNYIAPIPSSLRLNEIKSDAIGKSAYKIGLSNSAPITTKNYYPSGTKSALRRARSGGCTAPKKKGAIENTSSKIGGWGSQVRQNY